MTAVIGGWRLLFMNELVIGVILGLNASLMALAVMRDQSDRFTFDYRQTARLLAAKYLDAVDVNDPVGSDDAREWVGRQYAMLVATFGLPISATDAVVDSALGVIGTGLGWDEGATNE